MTGKYTKHIITALLLALVTWSCGDNGTGAESDNPPKIPDITAAQPDFSYFEGQAKMTGQIKADESFTAAQRTVLGVSPLFALGQLGSANFQMAHNEQAEFEDEQWVWTYSATYDGETIGIRLISTVNEDANEVQWTYYMSSSGGEIEFEEFKFMEGTTNMDGSTGTWTIYEPGSATGSEIIMAYEWDIDDDENLTASFKFPLNDSTLDYEQDGPRHTLSINEGDVTTEVYWDTENDQGYWWNKTQNEKLCWSSGKTNIACTTVGL